MRPAVLSQCSAGDIHTCTSTYATRLAVSRPKTKFGSCAFRIASPTVWNSLPVYISTPTNKLGDILDVIVAPSDHPPEDVMIYDVGLFDHMLVSWAVNLSPPLPVYVATTRRTWRTFKTEDFVSRLRSSTLYTPDDSDSSIDHLTEQYNAIITDLLDEMAPSKTVTLRERPWRPWYDDDCSW